MAGDAVIVAGFGFRSVVTVESLADALEKAGRSTRVARLATVADKAESLVFRQFARDLSLPVIPVEAGHLVSQDTISRSVASHAARGTGSVAEAAALMGAGAGARLLGPRVISGDGLATCALAEGQGP